MKKWLFVVLSFIVLLGSIGCSNQEQQEKPKEEFIEKETVSMLVAKFNKEVVDHNMEYPASEDYFQEADNAYWYGLFEDISLYLIPVTYTGNRDQDIVKEVGLFYDKESEYKEMAENYLYHLIKANDEDLESNDIEEIMRESKKIENEGVDEGQGYRHKGLLVSRWKNKEQNHVSIERKMNEK